MKLAIAIFLFCSQALCGPNLVYAVNNAVGPSFVNPTSLSGLTLWVDGSDPAGTGTPPSTGSTVTVLKDKGPGGYTFTETGTAGTYNATALNSKPAYKYPTSGTAYLTSPSTVAIGPYEAGSFTMFIAYVRNSITNNDANGDYLMRFISKAGNTYGPHVAFPYAANSTQVAIHGYIPAVTIGIPVASPLSPHIVSWNYVGTDPTVAANWTMALDGSTVTAVKDNITDGDPSANVFGHTLGRSFRGALGDVIMYNRSLNSTEMSQIYTYLHNKWGI